MNEIAKIQLFRIAATMPWAEVRYHVSDKKDQPELDAILAEIEARNKQPYQPDNKR